MAARPSLQNVMTSLTGLRVDGSIPGIQLGFTFSPTVGIIAGRIDKLGLDIRSFREPLKRAIQQVVIPSIRTNFDVGGRPTWTPLSDVTIRWRREKGISGSEPLVATGALRRNMGFFSLWDVNAERAVLKELPERIWYGAIHQSGIGIAAKGRTLANIVDDARSGKTTGRKVGIPARPFVVLQEEDGDAIQQVFADWMQERIDRAWPAGVL